MEDNCKVRLVNKEALARFGDSVYSVVRVRRDLNAVEIDELGTVALSDVVEVNEEGELIEEMRPPRHADLSSSGTQQTSTDDADSRIETIAGSLLGHPDPNVRLSMREILSLLWGE